MVSGLGGIFIKSADPKFLARWYEDNLGIGFGSTVYFSFKWRDYHSPGQISHTVLSFFRDDTTYFYPGSNDIMINLRVNDLDNLRIQLRNDGAFVIDKIESYEYGRFGWVLDPEGNKLELWEPIDDGFADIHKPMDLKMVTSLGGVFLKCPDPNSLMSWYSKQFGLFFNSSSHTFQWKDFNGEDQPKHTMLSFFRQDSGYFEPSKKNYMLNFRVSNLKYLLDELDASGVQVNSKIEEFEYGKFGWLMDPEGNKIELWEPDDTMYKMQ